MIQFCRGLVLSLVALSLDVQAHSVKFVIEILAENLRDETPELISGRACVAVNGEPLEFVPGIESAGNNCLLTAYADASLFNCHTNEITITTECHSYKNNVESRILRVFIERTTFGKKHLDQIFLLEESSEDDKICGETRISINTSDLVPGMQQEIMASCQSVDRGGAKSGPEYLNYMLAHFQSTILREDEHNQNREGLLYFPAGTRVQTNFIGESKAIEELRTNDSLCSYDFDRFHYRESKVKKTYLELGNFFTKIVLYSGESIISSPGQLFYEVLRKSWVEAHLLSSNSCLLSFESEIIGISTVEKIDLDDDTPVYAIALKSPNNFFVGEKGVLVHHCKPGGANNPR